MAKIPLTIDPEYCRSWGFFEGVREFLQNAKDADEYSGLPMVIEHKPRSEVLVVTTQGISISASDLLLLGRTSKRDSDQRGQFGEGFALGCLALVRAGHPVTIYNGHEKWQPEVSKAEDGPFAGNELLVMNTRRLTGFRPDFTIEIEGVSKDVWDATRKLFLFLAPPKMDRVVTVPEGSVLMEADLQGMVFVRGIFVMRNEDLEFGYDLKHAKLDRDRRMIDEWDLKYALGQVWQHALDKDPTLMAPKVYQMAKEGKSEVKSLHYHIDQRLVQSLREEFNKEHGEDTVPVSLMSDAREIEGLGGKVAVVHRTLQELLQKASPPLSEVKDKLRGKVVRYLSPSALTPYETDVCVELVESVSRNYAIVDFADATLCRLHEDDTPTVLVARSLLLRPAAEVIATVGKIEAKRCGSSLEAILIGHMVKDWNAAHPAPPPPPPRVSEDADEVSEEIPF